MKLWDRYPALFYGFALLAGISMQTHFWPPLLICLSEKKISRLIGFALLALLSYLQITALSLPEPPTKSQSGVGYFEIDRVKRSGSFLKGFNYKGVMRAFVPTTTVPTLANDPPSLPSAFYDLPCYIHIPSKKERPLANKAYALKGILIPAEHGTYTFKVREIEAIPYSFSAAEWRFKLKERLRQYLKRIVTDSATYDFFASLATGEIENSILGHQFSKVGLRHTLAISGFHYTWLTLIIGSLLQRYLVKRKATLLLLLIVTAYFLFIGEAPSLNRAWIAVSIYLASSIKGVKGSALNALGLALIIALALDPKVIYDLGFQFSFSATFAILTICPWVGKLFTLLLPKRDLLALQKLSFLDKHGALALWLIRESAALVLTVSLIVLPISLYHFGYFPLASLFFNLFFPHILVITMILLLSGILLPFLGPWLIRLNEWFTHYFIDMIYYGGWHRALYVKEFPFEWCSLIMLLFFSIGIILDFFRYQLTQNGKWSTLFSFCHGDSSSVG